jgi:branched-chain amino acid transport system permease protein
MGLSAIFKGSRVINAMQGEFAVIGAMTTVLLLTRTGWPYAAAIAGGAVAGALVGAFIEVAFVRYMAKKNASEDSFLLLTIGLALTLSASVLFFIGRDGHLLPPLGGAGVLIILDAVIQFHALWLIAIGIGATLALRAFYHRTTIGLSMMAASIDADGAATTGINVSRMRTYTFILGGLLGALGGILVTPLIGVDYQLGLNLTLKGFAAAVLGGLTNPLGAAVGGLTLGLVESLAIIGISSSYKDVVAFSVLIVIMILMPQGILGRAGRRGG